MRPEILKKFNLLKSNKNIGRSFQEDITIYTDKYSNYWMMCDHMGDPTILVNVLTRDKKTFSFSEECLLDYPVDFVYKEFLEVLI